MFDIESLKSKSDTELTKISKDLGIGVKKTSDINEKIYAILDFQASNPKRLRITSDHRIKEMMPEMKELHSLRKEEGSLLLKLKW